MNIQFKKGILEMCVLCLVARKDYYGYELIATISKEIEISEGTIYPILRRLTQEGFFKTYLEESQGGPPRKYYQITTEGKKATTKLLNEWNIFKKQVENVLNNKWEKENESKTIFR